MLCSTNSQNKKKKKIENICSCSRARVTHGYLCSIKIILMLRRHCDKKYATIYCTLWLGSGQRLTTFKYYRGVLKNIKIGYIYHSNRFNSVLSTCSLIHLMSYLPVHIFTCLHKIVDKTLYLRRWLQR